MNDKRKIIAIFIIVAIVAALAAVATFFVIKSAKNEAKGSSQMTETATEDSSDKEDPQHTGDNAGSMSVTADDGASADETQILSASTVAENSNLTFGIDVSKYQGTIKWDKVAAVVKFLHVCDWFLHDLLDQIIIFTFVDFFYTFLQMFALTTVSVSIATARF